MPKLFKKRPPLVHRGEEIRCPERGAMSSVWTLAAGGPKQVVGHPLGCYMGFDNRKALSEADTDAEMGAGEYASGRRMWPDDAVVEFFDTYTDGRVVTEDAFHQALTWLVTP